jgi:hypothetical protein
MTQITTFSRAEQAALDSLASYAAVNIEDMVKSGAYRHIVVTDAKTAVTVTRRHKRDRRDSRIEFVVTMGTPNYLAAAAIKRAKKLKLAFPLLLVRKGFPVKGTRGGKTPKKAVK